MVEEKEKKVENKKENENQEVQKEETPNQFHLSTGKKIILIGILCIILLFLYSGIWIHKNIIIKEYAIIEPTLPSNFNGLKITQFSDIHFGRTTNETEVEKMVKQINLTNADIVIFNGDLFDEQIILSDKSIDFLKNTLKNIKAKQKKYAIIGDSDYKDIEKYKDIMTTAGFKILENENDLVFYEGNNPILIMGITSTQKQEPNFETLWKTDIQNVIYKILIVHEPNIINHLNGYHPDLILAGHSLGGLISLPKIGGIIKKDDTDGYEAGYYEENGIKLYVTTGLGTEQIPFRFLNPPSIQFYRFYNY